MKVYSWEDLAAGKYASEKRLEETKGILLQELNGLYDKGWIESGFVYGSVARKDYSAGSDVDVLVVAEPTHRKRVEHALREIYAEAQSRGNVTLQTHYVTLKELQRGHHAISPYFFRHIVNLPLENGVGIPVANLISLKGRTAMGDARREITYLCQRARKNSIRIGHERKEKGSAYYKILTQSMEGVLNAARRALDVSGDMHNRAGPKKEVMEKFAQVFNGNPSLVRAFAHCMETYTRYKATLPAAMEAIHSQDSSRIEIARAHYETMLKQLEFTIPAASTFFTELLPYVHTPYKLRTRRMAVRAIERVKKSTLIAAVKRRWLSISRKKP